MKLHTDFAQKKDGQPTIEWLLARCGRITASDADCLVTPLGKVKTGDAVETYLIKKLAERWTGGSSDAFAGFESFAMNQGTILEDEAIPFAELAYNLSITQVGFVSLNDDVGCSPDGLVMDGERVASGIEIKCPQLETHMRYLLAGTLPKDYAAQVQFCMYVTGAANWHFLSYRRGFPALHVLVERDEKFQTAIGEAVDSFLAKLHDAMKRMIEINGGEPLPKTRGAVAFKLPEVKQPTTLDIIP